MKNNIIITGASSGVGKSLVEYFSEGNHVIALARRIERMEEYFGGNKNVTCYQCDLAIDNHIEEVLDRIKIEHGFIGRLINNAGILNIGSFLELSNDTFKKNLQINFLAPIRIMKELLPDMIDNNFGRIINITSGAPVNNVEHFSSYSASKASLNSVTITVAKEMAEKNIKINLMSPGAVKSEMAPDMTIDPSVCHPTADYLIHLDKEGETGRFFWHGHRVPLFADLSDTDWLKGKPGRNMVKVI